MLKSTSEFRDFYKDKTNVSEYDLLRLDTVKKRVVRQLERLFFTSHLTRESQLLEIGCGTGFITKALADICQVSAIDLSEEMMSIAAEREYSQPVNFQVMDAFKLAELGESKFDRIVSSRVMIHLGQDDLVRFLDQIPKLLKKGGEFRFDVQRPYILRSLMNKFQEKKVYNFPYSMKAITQLIENQEGLSLVRVEPIDHGLLLAPAYLLANFFNINWLEKNLLSIERGLLASVIGACDRWGIVVRKSF